MRHEVVLKLIYAAWTLIWIDPIDTIVMVTVFDV